MSFPVDFQDDSVVENPSVSAGDMSSIPGSGRSPKERNGSPLQDSCLGNPMVRGAWWATSMEWQRVGHDLVSEQQHNNNEISQVFHFPIHTNQITYNSSLTGTFLKKKQTDLQE